MPEIIGTEGDDVLTGTAQSDTIQGLGGDDVLIDTLGGNDTLLGGDGDDLITVVHGADQSVTSAVTVDGGAGNDRISVRTQSFSYSTITTGAGADVLLLDGKFQVTDFTPGNGGDRIDWTPVLARVIGWDQASNPFAGGQRLRVIDAGGAAVIQYALNGNGNFYDLAYLQGITAAQLTAFNLSGLTLDGAAPTNLALTGTAAGETLQGFAGNDTIDGLAGNDTIYGGIGNDIVHGGDNDDFIDGELGSDSLFGDGGNDTIIDNFGAAGSMDGGSGNDTLTVNLNDISYNVAAPFLGAYSFTRTLAGGDGNDLLTFSDRNDTQATIDGGNDDDEIHYSGGGSNVAVTILGGDGNDLIDVVGTSGVTVDAGAGNDIVIVGRAGSVLVGPTITLGAGVDTIRINPLALPRQAAITDFQTGAGGDVVDLTTLLDVNPTGWSYSGNPVTLSQQGSDVALLVVNHSDALLIFKNRTVAQFTAENFGGFPPNGGEPATAVIDGTQDDDTLIGTVGDDTIHGFGGNDTIYGGYNDDLIYGGEGADTLYGQGGVDRIEGEGGDDILIDVQLTGGVTASTLLGGDGNDRLTISRVRVGLNSFLDGGDGDDIIHATRITGTILGGAGNDEVTLVNCYDSRVTVDLGAGDDSLLLVLSDLMTLGGSLTLGAGKDQVTPATQGTHINILDFTVGEEGDRLDLSVAWGANPFGTGLTIVQQGADTVITTPNNSSPVFILRNVNATDLSDYNLGVPTSLFFNPAARNFAGTPAADFYVSADGNDSLSGQGDNDTLYGAGGNDYINGGAGDDSLYGGSGNDVLFGGTGADRLDGGDGNDQLWVDDQGDVVVEGAEGGADIVYTSVSYQLAEGLEIETFSTSDNGGTASLTLLGNAFSQTLYGNAGANYLDGGAGTDTLVGFGGDDSYVVDGNEDYVAEFAGGGNDTVYVRGSFSLGAGQEVETLAAFSQAGTAAITIVGNEFNQTLYGNAGSNYLDGGAGTDTLVGFGGDDSYVVDGVDDYVAEFGGGGIDTVYVRGSFSLGSGQEVETLAAFSQAGTAPIVIVGNNIAQRLFGNAGNNYLDGGGAADLLVGLQGNDTYVVDNAGDYVAEAAGEGNDIVYAIASFTLTAGQEIETLSTFSQAGTSAINLTGNAFANTIYANNGANILNGGGGNDVLQGFGGADSFQFTTALGAGNVDTLVDFLSGTDKLALDDAIFSGIGGPGSFNANAFVTGAAATNAAHRIVYNQATGQLFYDADGNGAGAAVLFATLSGNPALTASDFQVI